MVKLRESIIFLLLLILAVVLALAYDHIKKTNKDIYERIEKHEVKHMSHLMHNISEDLKFIYNIKNSDDILKVLSSKANREKYERITSLIMTENIKYAYILYKDKEDRFRFLLDASKEDRASFYQKFDVDDSAYEQVYITKKPQIIKQKDMQNLYITYLYPILNEQNSVIALFSIDITTNIQESILSSIKPLENFFQILIVAVLLFIFITIVQFFNYVITRKKVFIDPLTNTFNRNYLKELLYTLNLKNYAIAILDLDKFKQVNDTYGHLAGDFILVETTKIFKNSIRDSDLLIRYGGEEFLLLMHNRQNESQVLEICNRIKKNVSSHAFLYENNEINISISIGLHKHPALEKDFEEAIKIADTMLYKAKKSGRNRIEVYDEKNSHTTESLKDLSFIKDALNEDRVVCYYQPIYDYKRDKIIKYEALVRIVTKDGKIILPFEFLPKIKGTNLHYKLTKKILQIVFDKVRESKKEISVNVNFSDLVDMDVFDTITAYLGKYTACAEKITFEILESDEIDNVELFKEKTSILHSLGAKVSIDDFGSGYSNFKTILDVEANYLKIDGSLIKNIDMNQKDYKVVESIIHFASQSNMQTIAEFVHSKEVFEKLKELNVDFMQGYYISTPRPTLLKEEELFSLNKTI